MPDLSRVSLDPKYAPVTQDWADEPPAHVCGRCRTPFGPSSVPCPNNKGRRG